MNRIYHQRVHHSIFKIEFELIFSASQQTFSISWSYLGSSSLIILCWFEVILPHNCSKNNKKIIFYLKLCNNEESFFKIFQKIYMFHLYYMRSDVIYMLKSSTTHQFHLVGIFSFHEKTLLYPHQLNVYFVWLNI